MPNFKVHVASGIFLFPLIIPLFSLVQESFHLITCSDRVLVLSFIFFTLGTDAPDLDHKNAYLHRVAKVIIWLIAAVYLFFLLKEQMPVWFPRLPLLREDIIVFYISILIGLVVSEFLSAITPAHRGPFHSIPAPFVFGLITGILFYILEVKESKPSEAMSNAIYIGLSSFLGYTLHLLLDYIQSHRNRHKIS